MYCFWHLDFMLFLHQIFLGRRPPSVPERASPEKYDPVPEDTALGLFLSGVDRGIWLTGYGKVRVPLPTLCPL